MVGEWRHRLANMGKWRHGEVATFHRRAAKSASLNGALWTCVQSWTKDRRTHMVTFWSQWDLSGTDKRRKSLNYLERETGFEPATSTLARLRSTS